MMLRVVHFLNFMQFRFEQKVRYALNWRQKKSQNNQEKKWKLKKIVRLQIIHFVTSLEAACFLHLMFHIFRMIEFFKSYLN